jgi:hypothetical protein
LEFSLIVPVFGAFSTLPFFFIVILLVDRSNNLRSAAVQPFLSLRANNAADTLARTANSYMAQPRSDIVWRFALRFQVITEMFMPVTLMRVSRPNSIMRVVLQFPSR